MNKAKSVLLGMSGGTDSSVAAMLLLDAGYEVTGVTFRFYELNGATEYLDDARELAARLGIHHITYDARDQFRLDIVDYFISEYMAARTPIPCVMCNNFLKWPLLEKIADEMGLNFISTGHYVRKTYHSGYHFIRQAADPDKDQSFFLWGLSQQLLERMVLPMGEITKTEARELAARRGFMKVSQKKDSIGVCFCPFDYRTFLSNHADAGLIRRGRFLDEDNRFVGWHKGYPFYTIGQRRGLGIHLNRAVYVKEIRRDRNEVVLAPLQALERLEMTLCTPHVVDKKRLFEHDDIIVKIRYRKQANRCRVEKLPDGRLHVRLYEPLTGIASGQAAAFYEGDMLLGGGIIC